MQFIGAGLVSNVDDSLPSTVGGGRGARLDLEFVDGVDWRKENQDTRISIDAVDAINDVSDVFHRSTVDDGAVGAAAARIPEQPRRPAHAGKNARRKLDKLCEIARVQREIDDFLCRPHLPDFRGRGFDRSSGSGDGDLLIDRA